MKAIVNTGPNRLELQDLPIPEPAQAQVRIRTRSVGVCTTDLKMISGWNCTPFPSIPGHEWSGVVDAVGSGVDPNIIGQLCVAENILDDGGEIGFEYPGGYAHLFCTRATNLHFLPASFPAHLAALIEPLAVTLHGLSRLRYAAPAPAIVFGDGPLGLLFLAVLKSKGIECVDMVGGQEKRLALARELGARETFLHQSFTPARLNPPGKGYLHLVDASGSAEALSWAIQIAPRAGRVLVVGDYDEQRAQFSWNDLLHRELELIGSNASAGAWTEAVDLAVSGMLPLGKLVTHRLPPQRFVEAIRLTSDLKDECIKVVIDWP